MTAIVTRGDAANLQLPDETVDLIVTSPPYFGLRSYQDGGEHYAGQVGDEATPRQYLTNLALCTEEWMRVLKPGGSIFVNLGDKFSGGGSTHPGAPKMAPPKSLTGLPWRYALECIDKLGLILRAEIVWAKPNGLPESVTDRVRRSHEQVFHFVKQPRYFSAVDEVREEHTSPATTLGRREGAKFGTHTTRTHTGDGSRHTDGHPLGKLPGSVWTIPTAPLKVPASLGIDHFAAYPPELVRRIVLGWSPREVCTACGEGRRPQVLREMGADAQGRIGSRHGGDHAAKAHAVERKMLDGLSLRTITGYACGCPDTTAPSTPGVVLDPFGGTGTTALVASAFGRVGISVDLSADYCRLARWRTTDPGERARVLGVEKPPVQVDGQIDMFGELTA